MILKSLLVLFWHMLITQCQIVVDPTLKPVTPFSESVDGAYLKKELLEDMQPNRDGVANLWFHRTHEQRMKIAGFYKSKFCSSLLDGLKDISDDSLDDLYSDSFLSPQSLQGAILHDVIIGKWKEVGAIEEILCANTKDIKVKIADYYKDAFKDTLENQLGTFRREDQEYQYVMQKYCLKGLCQEKKIKPEDADKEAKALRDVDPEKDIEGFKKKLNGLLDKYCEPDMKMIFEKYRKNKDDGIPQSVEKAFKVKRVERAYNRLVRYIEDTCKFYADELHEAVDGCGTDTDRINRIVLTRCERDLGCILRKYKEIYGETFTERLTSDTLGEGRYRKSIRYLCGKP